MIYLLKIFEYIEELKYFLHSIESLFRIQLNFISKIAKITITEKSFIAITSYKANCNKNKGS
jgi:hypothetical protein